MKIVAAVLCGLVMCVPSVCSARYANRSGIGVVNLVRAINECSQGKAANAELNALVKEKRAVAVKKLGAMRKLKKKIERDSPHAKKADQAKLAAESGDYQKLVTASNAQIKRRAAELRSKVLKTLKKAIDSIGRREGFRVILTTAGVAYFQKKIDITGEVIKECDRLAGRR